MAAIHPPSAKSVRACLLFLMLLALESAPIQAWLIVYAAAQTSDAQQAAVPFWLIVSSISLFALARWRLARFGPLALIVALLFLGSVSLLAMTRFSPLMFGSEPLPLLSLAWVGQLFGGAANYSGLGGLILLVVYLWWRGSVLGAGAPAFSQVSRRFSIGMGALTLAIFGSLASAPAAKSEVSAALLALLALEGFGGLSALALSRPAASSGRSDTIMPGSGYSTRWQVTAIGIAFVIVAGVSLIGGALNLSVVHSLFTWLSPVVSLLNRFADWLTQSLAYVLYLLSVFWLSLFAPKNLHNPPTHLPQSPLTGKHLKQSQIISGAYGEIAALIIGALIAIGILVLLFFLARAMLNALNKPTTEEIEEERERLDASGLLKQQARDLLNRWRNATRRPARRGDLRRGGARWLYREVLRAAADAGYERRASETADEYAARLAVTLNAAGRFGTERVDNDLRALARAYDDARYGAIVDDPPASDEAATWMSRVVRRITTLGKQPSQERH